MQVLVTIRPLLAIPRRIPGSLWTRQAFTRQCHPILGVPIHSNQTIPSAPLRTRIPQTELLIPPILALLDRLLHRLLGSYRSRHLTRSLIQTIII